MTKSQQVNNKNGENYINVYQDNEGIHDKNGIMTIVVNMTMLRTRANSIPQNGFDSQKLFCLHDENLPQGTDCKV